MAAPCGPGGSLPPPAAAHVRIREERGLADTPPWTISYYPPEGTVGLIEFVMDGGEPAQEAAPAAAAENLQEEA